MSDTEPTFRLGGLSVWIDGYQYDDAVEYWDANWVNIRVECIGQQAIVKLCSPCLHLPDIANWAKECQRLWEGQVETATLVTMEPYLEITVDRSGNYKGLVATAKITPDNLTQFHEFRIPIDQSDLARLVKSLAVVLAAFPVRGKKPG